MIIYCWRKPKITHHFICHPFNHAKLLAPFLKAGSIECNKNHSDAWACFFLAEHCTDFCRYATGAASMHSGTVFFSRLGASAINSIIHRHAAALIERKTSVFNLKFQFLVCCSGIFLRSVKHISATPVFTNQVLNRAIDLHAG